MNWNVELEIAHKLAQMRGWLEQERAGALRLRGVDWFAWATAGASGSACQTAECGCAEVLVTRDAAYILTDAAEAQRLRQEEVRGSWTWQVTPWMQPRMAELREHFVQHAAGGRPVLCDRPGLHERSLPVVLREERLPLLASEQARYREVGRLAAAAASEALRAARPDWSEQELAGACARALWSRGLHAVYVLAAGAERFVRYRRAPPAASPLGERAVLALCAQRFGLCASLSRQRRFRPVHPARDGIGEADAAILALEAVALDACEVGHALSMVYHALDSAYAYAGQPDTVHEYRQGGIAGYRSPEVAAGAHTEIALKEGMALAFHPTLPGSMVEDTFLLSGGHLHNLTCDPDWPATSVQGRLRPLTLELP
ncbi:peptidase M24 [Janthinobacterium sp. BJB312]|nr:peptidase M24 [Janthinobacterium sp. BJB312]